MQYVREEIVLDCDANLVWRIVGDFHAIDRWLPGAIVVGGEGDGVGAVRRFTINDLLFVEEQIARDDRARRLTYSLREGPLPVADYTVGTVVEPVAANSALVEWAASFRADGIAPDKCEKLIRRAFKASLASLKAYLESVENGDRSRKASSA